MPTTQNEVRFLEPKALWAHFADLSAVPRASRKEEKAVAMVLAFGKQLGLDTRTDTAGNVLIRKPASPGREGHPTVILQAHLDMVHQKNADTRFDFDEEGIRSKVAGEWVCAEGTTLGADNGIGVAAILAVLESQTLIHPPLEALFTVDEETGMSGAKALQEGILTGKTLLNLDSEEDDELTIGCAGGLDAFAFLEYREETVPAGYKGFRVSVSGLKGGHSGVDIHLGRGNANKILLRLLYRLHSDCGLRLTSFTGGNLRNAIPREAEAIVALPAEREKDFRTAARQRTDALCAEYRIPDPDMKIEIGECPSPVAMATADDQERILRALYLVPNGVYRMSPAVPGLVETSNNLAKVTLRGGSFEAQCLQRSSVESGIRDIADAVSAAFETIGARVQQSGGYPGWAPNPDSPILKIMVNEYEKLFGDKPKVSACHAGLECGIIGEHYPGLDMVSFGPTIRHPHSPDEKVHIPSVGKFWTYLCRILEVL